MEQKSTFISLFVIVVMIIKVTNAGNFSIESFKISRKNLDSRIKLGYDFCSVILLAIFRINFELKMWMLILILKKKKKLRLKIGCASLHNILDICIWARKRNSTLCPQKLLRDSAWFLAMRINVLFVFFCLVFVCVLNRICKDVRSDVHPFTAADCGATWRSRCLRMRDKRSPRTGCLAS